MWSRKIRFPVIHSKINLQTDVKFGPTDGRLNLYTIKKVYTELTQKIAEISGISFLAPVVTIKNAGGYLYTP